MAITFDSVSTTATNSGGALSVSITPSVGANLLVLAISGLAPSMTTPTNVLCNGNTMTLVTSRTGSGNMHIYTYIYKNPPTGSSISVTASTNTFSSMVAATWKGVDTSITPNAFVSGSSSGSLDLNITTTVTKCVFIYMTANTSSSYGIFSSTSGSALRAYNSYGGWWNLAIFDLLTEKIPEGTQSINTSSTYSTLDTIIIAVPAIPTVSSYAPIAFFLD